MILAYCFVVTDVLGGQAVKQKERGDNATREHKMVVEWLMSVYTAGISASNAQHKQDLESLKVEHQEDSIKMASKHRVELTATNDFHRSTVKTWVDLDANYKLDLDMMLFKHKKELRSTVAAMKAEHTKNMDILIDDRFIWSLG
jgi:N-acetylmuramoyl-L-alanine amidase CwlA